MPKSNSAIRALAVVSSVSLFVGYVLYRGGVISLSSSPAQAQTRPTSAPANSNEFMIMAGSKSAAVQFVPGPATRAAPASERPRVMLPGSKSNTYLTGDQPVFFGDGHVELKAAPATAPSTQPRILLPGSKSFVPAP